MWANVAQGIYPALNIEYQHFFIVIDLDDASAPRWEFVHSTDADGCPHFSSSVA
jgi:hypothetical protein